MSKKRLETPLIRDFHNGSVCVTNITLNIDHPDVKIWTVDTKTRRFDAHAVMSIDEEVSHEIWLLENEYSSLTNKGKRRHTTKFFLDLDPKHRWNVSVDPSGRYEVNIFAFIEDLF